MTEVMTMIALAGSGLAGLSIAAYAGLKGWQGWLDFKRLELAAQRAPERGPAMDMIEMADLRERIRKLESIASCVDL
jgi:hypothetical protein